MKTKHSVLFLMACVAISFLIFFKETLHRTNLSDKTPRSRVTPLEHKLPEGFNKTAGNEKKFLKSVKKKKKAQMTPQPSSQTQKEKPQFSKRMKHIPFKMINGFAVAYGDLLLGKPSLEFSGKKYGFATAPPTSFWPSGVIPYHISKDVQQKEWVVLAMQEIMNQTQIQFIPYQNGDPDALVFKPHEDKTFCASYLGRIGGHQPIFLGSDCGSQAILHELMHALGFIHEQSRADRDQYLEVLWGNIAEDKKSQFAMVPHALTSSYRGAAFDFDYNSIMMYSENAFSKNPDLKTLKSKTDAQILPTQNGLSRKDIDRLNEVYR